MIFTLCILLSTLFSTLHAMEIEDTTNFAIKLNDISIEYALRNEYIQESVLQAKKHFSGENSVDLELLFEQSINHEMKKKLFFPLTLPNGTQQIAFFSQLSFNELVDLHNYYTVLLLTGEITKRVYCHCIVKWFLDNAIKHDVELAESIKGLYESAVNDFYKIAVPRCFQLFRNYASHPGKNVFCALNLPDLDIIQDLRLYKTLESFSYINDDSLSIFLQEQSLEGLHNVYNNYACFVIGKKITNITYLYILLKICQKENITSFFARYITKNLYMQTVVDYREEARKNLIKVFQKYKEDINEDGLTKLGSLNYKVWHQEKLNSFERLFLQYIFISKKEQSYCLYISSLNDVYILKTLFKEVLKKVELLRIDLPRLNSFEEINEFRDDIAYFPLLKGIDLLNITCDNIDFKNLLLSFFYKYEKIKINGYEYYSYNLTFQPVPVYIGKNVPETIKQILLHYKNFLLTSFVKRLVKDLCIGALVGSVASIGLGIFCTPIVHLFFSADTSYSKNEIILQMSLIATQIGSVLLEYNQNHNSFDTINRYFYSLGFSVIGLLLFYSYKFYYSNELFRADFKNTMGHSFICLTFLASCGLGGVGLGIYFSENKDKIKELGTILKYKQNIFAL